MTRSRQMTQCVFLVLVLPMILSHVLLGADAINDDDLVVSSGNVTNTTSSLSSPVTPSCVIRATLYVTPALARSSGDFGLPLDIDCSGNFSQELSPFDLGAQRVAGKRHVLLDGSQTPPLGVASYGLEYLDNCVDLESLEIYKFVGDETLKLSCGGAQLPNLTAVSFKDNELGALRAETFQDLPQLKRLELRKNSLKFLEILEGGQNLQELIIQDERDLLLKDNDFLRELTELRKLHLKNIKNIEDQFFNFLPENLTELLVENTPIQPGDLLLTQGISHLVNVSLTNCQLRSFSLEPPRNLEITHLNLSQNALKFLRLSFLDGPSSLKSLDLSKNQLKNLDIKWFSRMTSLERIFLQDNHFVTLSLLQLLTRIAPVTLYHLDLRSNELMSLKEGERTNAAYWNPQLRLLIDGNPWSCQWLLNFSHTQPQLFRLFQYSKYISHINVNGLSCLPQEAPTEPPAKLQRIMQVVINGSEASGAPVPVIHPPGNVSSFTVLYGNPVQLHRSQRQGALIIVFMLPLGIALLFLLLYLYLHCERLFHLSYYVSGLPCFGGGEKTSSRFVDHVDIVRYPIGNGSSPVDLEADPLPDGYETPVSGAASICNCTGNHRESACSRTHHVTYEALPAELPYQLYAEIKEDQDQEETEEMLGAKPTAPIYDHLSFEEEVMPKEKQEETREIS
ncbi:leucine-rich repeat neuronal protein 2 [Drosophila kikkawai]|uniref:Leucine-rich repeat neuronal protein 2 n=1 Tax=Drosophila kikkawai TaxID=30033 RepID=A0A6P4JBW9_DROKI|nr:uncharacterized protein LOC108086063 [Drosophila kikkawai]